MPNAQPFAETSRKRNLALAGLSAVAVVGIPAAQEALAPVCYWSGRLSSDSRSGLIPLAWAPENAPPPAAIGVILGWLGLWAATVFLVRRDVRLWARTAPLVLFLAIAWFTSRKAYACNIF